jgi:hypothetical protein
MIWPAGSDCTAWLPVALCRHSAVFLYLLPSIVLAPVLYLLGRVHPVFFLFRLAGTAVHEFAHFAVGLLTGARPQSFTVIPRRTGRNWQLGAVTFTHIAWYNAAPAALAPFLILLLPLGVALWRTADGLHFELVDAALALLLAPQFLSCWPSWVDWKIALRSWPYPVFGAAAWWLAGSLHP